jgi:hypothetical protein
MPKRNLSIIPINNDIVNYASDTDEDGHTDTEYSLNSPIIIPEHLETVKSSLTNYSNITDGNFGSKFTDDKIKRQFTHLVKGKSTLGVKLMYFKNTNLETFTKMFIYSKDPYLEPTNILIKILSEVYYHQQISKLQNTCNFKVPELISYGFIENNDDESINIHNNEYVFYIKMKDVSAIPVTNLNEMYNDDEVMNKCLIIQEEIDKINECLEKNNLFHNDLHSDNVMIDKNGNITIIDFGESSDILQKPFYTVDFCGKFKKGGGFGDGLLAFGRIRGQKYEKWLEQRLVLVFNDVDYINKVRQLFGYDKTNVRGRGQLTKEQVEKEVCERTTEDQQIIDPSLNCKKGGYKKPKKYKRTRRTTFNRKKKISRKNKKGGGFFDGLLAFGRIRGQKYEKWLEQRLVLVFNDVDYVNKVRRIFGFNKTNITGRGQLTREQVEKEVCERSTEDQQIIDPSLNCKKGGYKKTKKYKRTRRTMFNRKKKISRKNKK